MPVVTTDALHTCVGRLVMIFDERGELLTVLPVTHQQALAACLTGDLAGRVSAADHPVGGEGRTAALT